MVLLGFHRGLPDEISSDKFIPPPGSLSTSEVLQDNTVGVVLKKYTNFTYRKNSIEKHEISFAR
jgi:hypothetical protein